MKTKPGHGLMKTLRLFVLCALLCCLAYPALILGAAQLMPHQGRPVTADSDQGEVVLQAGQPFHDPENLWGRWCEPAFVKQEDGTWLLYAAGGHPQIDDPQYEQTLQKRRESIRSMHPQSDEEVPEALITESASGMDPDIPLEAALYQSGRIAAARGMAESRVREIIEENTRRAFFNVSGEKLVNVVRVNLDLQQETEQ